MANGARSGTAGGVSGFDPTFFAGISPEEVARRQRLGFVTSLLTVGILAIAAAILVFTYVAYYEPQISPALEKAMKTTPDKSIPIIILTTFSPCDTSNLGIDVIRRQAGNDFAVVQQGAAYCMLHIEMPAERIREVGRSWSVSYIRTLDELEVGVGGAGLWRSTFIENRENIVIGASLLIGVLLIFWFYLEGIIESFPLLEGVVYSGLDVSGQQQDEEPYVQQGSGYQQQYGPGQY